MITHNNSDFEVISVTERSCAAPILILKKKKKNGLNRGNAARLKRFLFKTHSLMVVMI